ncbi:hypothetical protein C0Q70_09107 [Pomacea canaliculata]|uniref:TLC domain-containing protein n=1 Tax=Pomacea canaliculata TaxID=400727 RepID=A0A2T7P8W3_POMCA|nr:hypothetical protein C0Q70_09107 [Pomacea canaliculata]
MATLVDKLNSIVWNEKWWLGDDAKWDDFLSSDPNIYYPRVKDMNWSLAVGVGLLAVRYVYENVLIVPLANYLGIYEQIDQADRFDRKTDTEVVIPKEDSKSWLYVTVNCWINWPKQHIDTEIYTFYLLELSFYWSLLFAIIFQKDYQKKDKNEMILHHCVTILLIYFSWACNFVRVGTLVLVVHDVADPWLAVAKMAKYAKKQATCEAFFGIFSVVWIISRCCIYPLWVLNTSAVEIHDYVTTFPAYWFFNGLLFVLQILHLLWTYLILRIAFQKFQHGSLQKDERSESESETDETSSDEDEDNNKISKRVISNGILGNQYKSQLTAEQ